MTQTCVKGVKFMLAEDNDLELKPEGDVPDADVSVDGIIENEELPVENGEGETTDSEEPETNPESEPAEGPLPE